MQIDQQKMLIEQANLKSQQDDLKIQQLSCLVNQKGSEINKDDMVIHKLQRQISLLTQELDQERVTNNENKIEMEKLVKDVEMISQMGTNRECDLQRKLDEQFALRRTDKLELQKAQMELKRAQNMLSEQKI